MDYMQDVEQARRALEAALQELEPLRASMPDGADKLRVLNATTHLVAASLAINFRVPGVASRLDFVATTPNLTERLPNVVTPNQLAESDQHDFTDGGWVADFSDPDRPRIAKVKNIYGDKGELLLDLVLYGRDGTRVGRASPACGGPRGFEPAMPAAKWEPIEEPEFEYLAGPRYNWGDRVRRLRAKA